jgi:hypothetical protein
MRKLLLFAAMIAVAIGCSQPDTDEQFVVDIDTIEGLWIVEKCECYKYEKLYLYDKAHSGISKYHQDSHLIFSPNGVCKQLYAEFVVGGDNHSYYQNPIEWSFNADTKVITLTNNNLKEPYRSFAVTELKVIKCDNGDFILEGLQPTPYDYTDIHFRLYGKIGSAEQLAEYESKYSDTSTGKDEYI